MDKQAYLSDISIVPAVILGFYITIKYIKKSISPFFLPSKFLFLVFSAIQVSFSGQSRASTYALPLSQKISIAHVIWIKCFLGHIGYRSDKGMY